TVSSTRGAVSRGSRKSPRIEKRFHEIREDEEKEEEEKEKEEEEEEEEEEKSLTTQRSSTRSSQASSSIIIEPDNRGNIGNIIIRSSHLTTPLLPSDIDDDAADERDFRQRELQ